MRFKSFGETFTQLFRLCEGKTELLLKFY